MEKIKQSKGLIWLIIILIIVILGLVGFIIYDKVLSNDKTVPNKNTTSTIQKQEIENENSDVYNDIIKILDEYFDEKLDEYNIKFDYDYINNDLEKANIVKSVMMSDDNIKKEFDIDIDNNEVTGAIRFDKKDFVDTYISVIGEQPDFDKIINATNNDEIKIEVKDDLLAGTYITGRKIKMTKLNSITCNNDKCKLKIDCVYETTNNSNLIIDQYENYENTNNFDDNLINAVINIDLTKNNDGTYKINHFIIKEK